MLYSVIKNLFKIILILLFKIDINGEENIPQDRGLIVCSNHYHWLDPIVVACFFNRKVHFMAKKELFKNKYFGMLLKRVHAFPVNRGAADITAIKTALRVVKSQKVLGIFPEGTRVKAGQIGNAEPGIAMIGIKGEVDILPIGINGNYKFRSKLYVNIGQAINLEQYYKKKVSAEELGIISRSIMVEVRKLING